MSLFGLPNIEKLKKKRNMKELIKALNYKLKWEVRAEAARALGEIGMAGGVEPVISTLKDKESGVREAAAEALDNLGWQPEKNAAGVYYFIAKHQWDKCIKVGSAAFEPLIGFLQDEDKIIRETVADTLDKLGWQPDNNEAGAAFWIAKRSWEKCVEIGARAVEPLIARLGDQDHKNNYYYPCYAAETLAKIGDKRAVESLIAALQHKGWNVREVAARALGQIGDPRAVQPLITAFQYKGKGSTWHVREAAIKALGQIGDKEAVLPLIAILEELSINSRLAAKALGEIGDPRAIKPLRAVRDKKRGLVVDGCCTRSDAIETLKKIHGHTPR